VSSGSRRPLGRRGRMVRAAGSGGGLRLRRRRLEWNDGAQADALAACHTSDTAGRIRRAFLQLDADTLSV